MRARPECDYQDRSGRFDLGGCKAMANFVIFFYHYDEATGKVTGGDAKYRICACRVHAGDLHRGLTLMGGEFRRHGDKNLKLSIIDMTRSMLGVVWEMCDSMDDYMIKTLKALQEMHDKQNGKVVSKLVM